MNDVLLLNQDYSPLKITSLKRGFKLVFKGKAEVIHYDELKPNYNIFILDNLRQERYKLWDI